MTPTDLWIQDVARVSGVALDQLTRKDLCARRPIVRLRQALMFVLVRKDRLSYTETARRLGGFNHSTVIYGVDAFDNYLRKQDAKTLRAYRIAIRCRVKQRRRTGETK